MKFEKLYIFIINKWYILKEVIFMVYVVRCIRLLVIIVDFIFVYVCNYFCKESVINNNGLF